VKRMIEIAILVIVVVVLLIIGFDIAWKQRKHEKKHKHHFEKK